jgi:hypothetical protein
MFFPVPLQVSKIRLGIRGIKSEILQTLNDRYAERLSSSEGSLILSLSTHSCSRPAWWGTQSD